MASSSAPGTLSSSHEEPLTMQDVLREFTIFLSVIVAAASVDAYILRNNQNASQLLIATGINLPIFVGYCISYASRVEDTAIPQDREKGLNTTTPSERSQIKVCGKTLGIPNLNRCLTSASLAGTTAMGVNLVLG